MRKYFVFLIKSFLPNKWINILIMKPRLMFVDIHTAKQVKWTWKQVVSGVNYRGNQASVLRKQAHILEKGIQIPNRESGHSKLQYQIVKDLLAESTCQETNIWAKKILELYENVQNTKNIDDDIYIPISEKMINLSEFERFSQSRRSIRYFKEEKVPDEIIIKVSELLNWTPNSCNRQNTKIYVTSNDAKIRTCMSLNGGATCMNEPSHFISVVSDTRSYMLPVEKNAAYIDASLAVQNFILGLHSEGVGSCILNWTHATQKQELELKENLEIEDYELIILNIVIGYPKLNILASSKKNSDQTIKFK